MEKPPVIPDFTLLRRIGGGSYGDVWLGRSVTGIYRAVKLVARSRFADESPYLREFEGITRFQKAVGDQPQQLALLHVGEDPAQGLLFYVMELADDAIEGTDIDPATYVPLTLKEFNLRRPRVPADECIDIAVSLGRALVGLHKAGLIHRDVKPSNIIFVNRVPKLADIGLVSSSEHTMTSLGTPGYAPPEGGGTTQADVYGLGKIIYQLASGLGPGDFPRLPVDATSRPDVARLMELNEVFLRACHPEPVQRYQTAQALLDDLLLLQAGRSVKELIRTRERVRVLRRVSVAVAIFAFLVVSALGVQNYLTLRKLAAQEKAAREKAEADERLARYSADLHAAQLAISIGDTGLARAALRRQQPVAGEPDLRGLEWRALWNETAGDQTRTYGQVGDSPVRTIAAAPDGRSLAVQTTDGVTALLDLVSGQRRKLAEKTYGLGGFTSDGAELIVGTSERKLRRINVATGALSPEQSVTGRITAMADDGRTVLLGELVGNGIRLRVWDAVAERELGRWESGERTVRLELSATAIARDARKIAISTFWTDGAIPKRELLIWDVAGQRALGRNVDLERVRNIAFSRDGARLAVVMNGRPVTVLDGVSGAVQFQFSGHTSTVQAVDFSPDGATLATGARDQTIRLWGLQSGTTQPQRIWRGHEEGLMALRWTGDGKEIWSGAEDGTVRTWSPTAPPARPQIAGLWNSTMGDVIFSPDGAEVAVTNSTGQVELRDARTLIVKQTIPAAFQALAYRDNGQTLVALDAQRKLVVWDRSSNAVRVTLLRVELEGDRRISYAQASADGSVAVLGLTDGEVRFWDLVRETELSRNSDHKAVVMSASIAQSKQLAATGDHDGLIKVWSLPDGKLLQSFSTNGHGWAFGLAFDERAQRLAVGTLDGRILIWGLAEKAVVAELRGHSRRVHSLAWAESAGRFLSASNDGTVVSWTSDGFRRMATLSIDDVPAADRGITLLQLDAQKQHAAVLLLDGRLRMWKLSE